MKQRHGFITFIALAIAALFAFGIALISIQFAALREINSYDDCIKAGYPALLSFPGRCNTPDGRHFVQQLSDEEKKKLVPPTPTPTGTKFCGGIAGNLPQNQCPPGYHCQLSGSFPDAGGACVSD